MSPSGLRVLQGAVLALAVIAIGVVSSVTALILALGTCDGDGGSPYAAVDSTAGRFCDGPLYDPWAAAMIALPALIALGLGVVGVIKRRWLWLAVGSAAGVVVAIALAAAVVALPKHCSDADQQAYDEWKQTDEQGPQPASCDTY